MGPLSLIAWSECKRVCVCSLGPADVAVSLYCALQWLIDSQATAGYPVLPRRVLLHKEVTNPNSLKNYHPSGLHTSQAERVWPELQTLSERYQIKGIALNESQWRHAVTPFALLTYVNHIRVEFVTHCTPLSVIICLSQNKLQALQCTSIVFSM